MVSRLWDDDIQGRDGRCVENNSCFEMFLFVPFCILLLGSPAGLIVFKYIYNRNFDNYFGQITKWLLINYKIIVKYALCMFFDIYDIWIYFR